MKANQKIFESPNDRAEVGVGTLIVFIAMVLVAAVAAAVLINTSGTLQQRAQSTGTQATQEVSSNLQVEAVYGVRGKWANSALNSTIENVTLNVGLAAGATPMDLSQLIIRYSDGTNVREMAYKNAMSPYTEYKTKFDLTVLRDQDSSYTNAAPVINSGDLVKVNVYKVNLATRTAVTLLLIPEAGASTPSDFSTPATYGTQQQIQLR